MEQLSPRVIWLWRIGALIRALLFWAPLAAFAGVGLASFGGAAAAALIAGGPLLLIVFLGLAWPSLSWRYFGFSLREHDLLVQRGVLYRRRTSIPVSRIQHVETRQGPFERMLGLSRVLVYTASGFSAEGSIPGLDTQRAEELRDTLAQRGEDDGV